MLEGLDTRISLIYEPIVDDLLQVEEKLATLSQTDMPHMSELLEYVLQAGGKRMRPAITLLAGNIYPHSHSLPVIMAAAVELLHVATLIHDDTVDNSPLRRGRRTVTDVWGKDVAVLLGDYVFATSAVFVCDTNNVRVIRRFSETLMDLSSGEIQEYFSGNYSAPSRMEYESCIYKKTASLFQTASETGAILTDAPEDVVSALKRYGYNIGMAFQVIDDILDVTGNSQEIGKPVGNDLLQGVLTLPAIILMERDPNCGPLNELVSGNGRSNEAVVQEALEMLQNPEIISSCFAVAREYCSEAAGALSIVPDSPARSSLLTLTEFVRERSY